MNEINKNNLAVRNTLYARTLGTLEILYNGVPWELPMSVKGKVMQRFHASDMGWRKWNQPRKASGFSL